MQKLKWILIGVIGSLAIAAVFALVFLKWNKSTSIDPFNIIPKDAMYIFESEEPISNWNRLQKNSLWTFLSTHPTFKSIKEDADYVDSLIQDNKFLLKTFGNRKFICSAHPLNKREYDFLLAFDLKSAEKLVKNKDILVNLLEETGYNVSTRKVEEFTILACKYPGTQDVLYLCQIENYLACSYSSNIIESSVRAYRNPSLSDDKNFQICAQKLKKKGFGTLYLNWPYTDELLDVYSSSTNGWLKDIFAGQSWAAFDLYLEDRAIHLKGYSHAYDSALNYLNALRMSGAGTNTSADVLSNRTAFAWTLCVSEMNEFYSNLRTVMGQNPGQLEAYDKKKKQVESFLKIEFESDLLSWMAGEVTIAQNKKYTQHQSDEYIALIKLANRDKAAEKLNFLNQQVKKRTPAKFKKIHFKSYTIHYLEFNGAFELLFGDLFKEMEKPYYTFMGDYLVMSNSSLGLIGLIDDYENKRILSGDINYQAPDNQDIVMNLYIAPFNTYEALKPKFTPERAQDWSKSKSYFEGMGSFSLSISNRGNLLYFESGLTLADEEEEKQLTPKQMEQIWKENAVEEKEGSAPIIRIIEDGYYKQFHPGSEQLHIKGKTKWGIMHGKYNEFYLTGELKCSGKYRKGQKVGTWKYYNENGELVEKRRY